MPEENMIEPENEELEEENLDEPIEDELEKAPVFDNRQPDIYRADSYNRTNRNGFNSRRQRNLNNQQQTNRINKRPNTNISNNRTNQTSSSVNNYNKSSANLQKGIGSLFGNKKDGKFTIKLPVKTKIVFVVLLISIPFILLMVIVVILGGNDNYSSSSSGMGSFTYGQTCTKVTVTGTGCDSNGENCTNQYDGEVELEEYIAGVVAAEAAGANNTEYYKAVAISARTYYLSNTNDDCTIEGNSNAQLYMDVDDSSDAELIRQAVEETKALVLIKDEELIKTSKLNQSDALSLITNQNYTYDKVLEYYYGSDVEIKENKMQLGGIEGFINPTRYIRCSSAFGYRIHPVKKIEKLHTGLDIGISGGEPIYAAKDGTITYVKKNVSAINNCDYGYGNYITIDHGDGKSTLYAHIKYGTIPESIVKGDTVSQGEIIGQVGSTGCSTGNHLHYEVKENGNAVDPAAYLDLTGATGKCQR